MVKVCAGLPKDHIRICVSKCRDYKNMVLVGPQSHFAECLVLNEALALALMV